MSLPPKVIHIIYALGTGGLENGLVNIVNRTPVGRYRHVIVCLTEATNFSKRITVPGVEVVQLHKKPGQDWGLYFRLLKILFSLRPNIVHTRNLASLEMQALTLLLPGVKRVHSEHGHDIYDLGGTNKKYNLLRKSLRPFVHQYIAVSKDLENWLKHTINVPSTKLCQIYNGVDSEKFHFRRQAKMVITPEGFLPKAPIVVGTVGRIAEVKNQKLLVDGIKLLIEKRPELKTNLRLVLVGDGPLYNSLKDYVAEIGLSGFVWMTGDRDDVPELMQLMDIFVLPSLSEGISNTILEAMATCLPVIATNVGGTPELISDGDNGRLISVDDEIGLALTIGDLIDNPESRIKMGRSGFNIVKSTFSWSKTVSKYLSVYDELLGVSKTT